MNKYVVSLLTVLTSACPLTASAELPPLTGTSRYVVSCQSTETADMKDAIKRKFSVQVAEMPTPFHDKKVTVKIKHVPTVTTKSVDELTGGLAFGVDPTTGEGFVSGDMTGIACFNEGTVTVYISGVNKAGETIVSPPTISKIRIPGSFAIKGRIS